MANFGRNTAIKLLRSLDVTEEERAEIRSLIRYYEENDLYEEIASRNLYAFGEEISPMQLSYNTVLEILNENPDTSARDIIAQYQENITAYESGTTAQIESFISNYTDELQDLGAVVTPEQLRNIFLADKERFNDIEKYKASYLRYHALGDSRACNEILYEIQRLIDGTSTGFKTMNELRGRTRTSSKWYNI